MPGGESGRCVLRVRADAELCKGWWSAPFTGYQGVMTTSQLVRPRSGKMIAGVCAALGNRFGISTGLIRIAFVIFGLVGAGELAYIILWIVIPKEQ